MTAPGARSDHDLVHAPEPGGHPVADGVPAASVGGGAGAVSNAPGSVAAAKSVAPAEPSESAGRAGRSESTVPAESAVGGAPSRRLARSIAAAVAGLLAGVAAVLLVRNGIRTNTFPPYLDGTSSTTITRYSGPWLTAGAGAALLAALLLLSAVLDLRRWLVVRRSGGPAGGAPGGGPDVIGATSP